MLNKQIDNKMKDIILFIVNILISLTSVFLIICGISTVSENIYYYGFSILGGLALFSFFVYKNMLVIENKTKTVNLLIISNIAIYALIAVIACIYTAIIGKYLLCSYPIIFALILFMVYKMFSRIKK